MRRGFTPRTIRPIRPIRTLFLLSPAHCGGRRGVLLLGERGASPLAVRLRAEGVAIGEVFSFLSGLYFRGKLAYGLAFSRPASAPRSVLVIVPGLGLTPADAIVTMGQLRKIARIGVDPDDERFRGPLERDAAALAATLSADDRVVLLGSIATEKYSGALLGHLGARLLFPTEFVGRGDMSRGGLLLRSVTSQSELDYVPLEGAVRRGRRPPRLEPLSRTSGSRGQNR